MNIIKTIDLWIEARDNHYECFNGAFYDGFADGNIPYDKYKIIRNCNCIIDVQVKDVNIFNKHHAVVFYKHNKPVRLLVINKDTNIDKCISLALNQYFNSGTLIDVHEKYSIKSSLVDLNEKPIINKSNDKAETDVGSCDRWSLLYNMLKGSYTEDDSPYGNFQSDKYEFIPNLLIKLHLNTDTETFDIIHKCGFINDIKTRLIPIQEDSSLTSN